MAKNYIYTLIFFFLSIVCFSQESKQSIDGVSIYPNPVENGKIYITSKSSLEKDVSIFNILGKKVYQATISTKEMNVSFLIPGVYIIKIKEADTSTTRKLIVK